MNPDNGAGSKRRAQVTEWLQGLQTAKPGCQIQEAVTPPYEAETVLANKEETEEEAFQPPGPNFSHQSKVLERW